MATLLEAVVQAQSGVSMTDADFPLAPDGWNRNHAVRIAQQDKLALTDDHWKLIQALQEYFARHTDRPINMRELHDALDERFHKQGGLKYLYQILPGGPIAQGCRLAGLEAPAGAADRGFGSTA
jgi:tRNA 2-thiouridine synthesizing protein E